MTTPISNGGGGDDDAGASPPTAAAPKRFDDFVRMSAKVKASVKRRETELNALLAATMRASGDDSASNSMGTGSYRKLFLPF